MIKLYPSSAAFKEGDLVFTQYDSGCLRNLLLKAKLPKSRGSIGEHHEERGALNEDVYEKELVEQDIPFHREVPFKFVISDDPGAYFSGRIDYIVYPDEPGRSEIRELKSTESSTVYREVIKKGKVKLANVAQVVTYMMATGIEKAQLNYRYFKRNKKTKVLTLSAERAFSIQVEDSGRILVDNEPMGHYIHEVVEHALAAARVIMSNEIASRPYAHDEAFSGPCYYCPFRSACDLYDAGIVSSIEEFISEAENALKRAELRKLQKKEKEENERNETKAATPEV